MKYLTTAVFVMILTLSFTAAANPPIESTNTKIADANSCPPMEELITYLENSYQCFVKTYYFDWYAILTPFPITEEDIIDGHSHTSAILVHSDDLLSFFKSVKLKKLKNKYKKGFNHCRISVFFYGSERTPEGIIKEKTLLRISIGNADVAMLINGEPYQMDWDVAMEMFSYLPHKEYARIMKIYEPKKKE